MKKYLTTVALLAISMVLTRTALRELEHAAPARALTVQEQELRESLYLLNGRALNLISFGYRNALANYLWFNTISYFGKQYRGERSYTWLGAMCDVVTDLSPLAAEPYDFCASMLAWEASKPQRAVQLLDKAVRFDPQAWYHLYLRGFMKFYFLNDASGATADFVASAKLPHAHALVKRLAARGLVSNDPTVAIEFLEHAILFSKDAREREVLSERLHEAQYLRDTQQIKIAVERFTAERRELPSSLDELVREGYLSTLTKDPWGGDYQLVADGSVTSTSNRKVVESFHRHPATQTVESLSE